MVTAAFDFDTRSAAVDAIHAATAIFTAEAVVDSLLDRLGWPLPGATLLDPSAGDGSFLVRALKKMNLEPGDRDNLDRVRGWELHPGAVRDARDRIESFLVSTGWGAADAAAGARAMILEADFLTDGPTLRTFDFICGNPPYLRYANVPELFRRIYEEEMPTYCSDLLHAFLDRCSRMVSPGGQIGFVTSDRWLFNETAGELRESLGQRVGLTHLARLDPSTCFYRPKSRRQGTPARIHPVEVVMRPAGAAARAITREAISPDGGSDESTGPVLGDVATVRIGPWLGTPGIFVVSAAVARTLSGAELIPAVDTDDIDPHTDILGAPKRFAIRTNRTAEPIGAVKEHLLRHATRMCERGRQKPYWQPPESITLPLDRPSLIVPRIARRLRAIPLPAGILPINHNLSVVSAVPGLGLEDLRKAIVSDESQAWIKRNAPRLENGYYSITTKFLRRMPIPAQVLRSGYLAGPR